MLDNRKQLYINFIRITEAITVILAAYLSLLFCANSSIILFIDDLKYISSSFLVSWLTTLSILIAVHLMLFDYYYAHKHQFYLPNLKDQAIKLGYTTIADCAIFFLIQHIFGISSFNNSFYIIYIVTSLTINLWFRATCYIIIKEYISYKNNHINILVVGSNRRAVEFNEDMQANDFLGYNIIGFLDDINHASNGLNMLGELDDLPKILRENVVDSLVVCLPIRSFYDKITKIISQAEEQGVSIHYMNSLFEPKRSHLKPARCGDVSCLLMHTSPINDWKQYLKRIFDIFGALGLLLLASPVMLAASLAIKLHDKGPVFYSQTRVGYYKRKFTVLKFRSMELGAEDAQVYFESQNEMDGPVFKISKDPRVTKPGRFIRRYGIDELPQLLNVLKGDMSLVGPRPLALRDYNGFSEDWLRRRFSVRPGLTCYWQCMKNRNCLSFRQWMDLDMKYIDNWSFFEDIKICMKTLPAILSGTGM